MDSFLNGRSWAFTPTYALPVRLFNSEPLLVALEVTLPLPPIAVPLESRKKLGSYRFSDRDLQILSIINR